MGFTKFSARSTPKNGYIKFAKTHPGANVSSDLNLVVTELSLVSRAWTSGKFLDFFKAFNREKKMLQFFGIYPTKAPKHVLHFLLLLVIYGINILNLILVLMLLIVKDLSNFVQSAHFAIIVVTSMSKASLFAGGQKQFKEIEDHITAAQAIIIPEEIMGYVIKEEKSRNRLYVPQRLLVISGLLFKLIVVVLLHNQRPHVIIGWSPFDLHNLVYYYPTIIIESAAYLSNAYCNVSMDVMYYVLIDIACCEMDILMFKLTNLNSESGYLKISEDLKECIIYHQNILSFIKVIQKLYSRIIFTQCIGSMLIISYLGFQLAATTEFPSGIFVSQVIYFASMVFQIFIYTWFGQKFMDKSQDITQACYLSEWHKFDIRIQKTILVILTRSTRPCVLVAGTFDLTLETFVKIIKSSYSYMTVLNTMYSK
ncbi:odorant receptor 85b-like [Diabrotica undecimpunctata]|uniref:odorant receptor 85b-like n=1 Tax=Diabrotica undecimpunctata TaxID=50387 RepID=UPI003B634A40